MLKYTNNHHIIYVSVTILLFLDIKQENLMGLFCFLFVDFAFGVYYKKLLFFLYIMNTICYFEHWRTITFMNQLTITNNHFLSENIPTKHMILAIIEQMKEQIVVIHRAPPVYPILML